MDELLPNQLKDLEEHRAAVERLNNAKTDYMKKYGANKPPESITDIISDMAMPPLDVEKVLKVNDEKVEVETEEVAND